jgi:hypothetical protein
MILRGLRLDMCVSRKPSVAEASSTLDMMTLLPEQ